MIEPDVIVDAKSGVSGAGRALRLNSHFSEVNEDVSAYGLGGHRHMPEIRQQLRTRRRCVRPANVHAAPRADDARHPGDQLRDAAPWRDARRRAWRLESAYLGSPLSGLWSSRRTRSGRSAGTSVTSCPHGTRKASGLILVSAIDNLVKGAAGQAIQCANLMYGLDEAVGLPREGVYP